MANLNYDPRPPERRFESEQEPDRLDKVAEGFIAFGQMAIALGVVIFAILLLISML